MISIISWSYSKSLKNASCAHHLHPPILSLSLQLVINQKNEKNAVYSRNCITSDTICSLELLHFLFKHYDYVTLKWTNRIMCKVITMKCLVNKAWWFCLSYLMARGLERSENWLACWRDVHISINRLSKWI